VKERDVIEALDDFFLHLADRQRVPCHAETKLGRPPILFDKIELTVVLGVEIAKVPMGLNQLLKLGLLIDDIGLQKKYTPATAVSAARRTMKAWALGKEISFGGPQTALANNDLHALEPARHGGVVFSEIEWLGFAIWECAAAHAWTAMVVRPSLPRSCEREVD
jgi:hypothetical protein